MLMNEELHEAGCKKFCLPATRIPEWFEHQRKGVPMSFWFRNKFPAISLCLFTGRVASWFLELCCLKLIINGKKAFPIMEEFPFCCNLNNGHILIFSLKLTDLGDNVDEVLLENEWNHVVFAFDFVSLHRVLVRNPFCIQTGLHVLKQTCSMEDMQFEDPYISMLEKEKHKLDTVVSQIPFVQHQQNSASLALSELHVGRGLPPPALNDNVNQDSNLMVSMRKSSTTVVRGFGTASRKRKIVSLSLDLDNEPGELFCHATSKVVLDSDSIMPSLASDTTGDE
ncbi:uncharacterized protein LOC133300863, partial [Gastrolobium bilobum]|uniref:uncharacterized protein LOC133300863 n=1 Tax=Gastrolobium bilobum TaxID=150636 RepID=UPI002AAFB11B